MNMLHQSLSNQRWFRCLWGVAVVALLAACQPVLVTESTAGTLPPEEAAATDAMSGGAARFAYVGAYTRGAPGGWSEAAEANPPEGISAFAVDAESGALTHIQTVPSDNPSFLALHPSQDYLYAINEIADYEGNEDGSIEAYAIDNETGMLTLLNRVSSAGSIPAHLMVDPTGTHLAVGNYVGGTFALLPINEDGSLGEATSVIQQGGSGPHERQTSPHPHAVMFDPSGNYIATADLGTDQIQVFQIEGEQLVRVSEAMVAPGSGPRHLAFHPNGNVLYVINELTAMITALEFDPATGALGAEIQNISTVPEDFPEHKSTAEIMVDPTGNFLYGSNRKSEDHPLADSIVAYRIDEATGELSLIGHTTEGIVFPRGFNLDPSGTWLYALNQKGDTIVQFAIDPETGELSPTGEVADVMVPVSIVFKQ